MYVLYVHTHVCMYIDFIAIKYSCQRLNKNAIKRLHASDTDASCECHKKYVNFIYSGYWLPATAVIFRKIKIKNGAQKPAELRRIIQ